MANLDILEQLVNAGFTVKMTTVKTIRNGQDVKLVVVNIEGDYNGEGTVLADALAAALLDYKTKITKLHDRYEQVLAVLASVG